MGYYKIVSEFITKDSYDFDKPNACLYDFHPQFRIFLLFLGIFFNNRNSIIRLIWPICCILLTLVAISLEMMFIYRGVVTQDYSFASECFCYFVLLGIIPVVYTSFFINRDKIIALLEDMNAIFIYICSLGPRYRDPFLGGQLLIWKLCYAWFAFVLSILSLFVLFPLMVLLYQSLFATQDEHVIRPLLFPMWLPEDDPYRTPNYEIFLFLQINYCFIFLQTFCVYIYILFHVLLHYYYLVDMIILDIEVIFDGLDESVVDLPRDDSRRVHVQMTLNRRMKRIVEWHISVFRALTTLSSMFGPPLVYQVMFSSIAICLMAYRVADIAVPRVDALFVVGSGIVIKIFLLTPHNAAVPCEHSLKKLDHGTFDVLFTMLGIGACLQLWIVCFLGTVLRNKAFAIGKACWNCGWQKTPLGRMIRADLIIVILRAQQPVSIKFIGLPNVELETFSSIMSTSYSYFNMLRQYN